MNGSNDVDNLVYLTAREHYIAHWLLHKIYPESYKLLFALHRMMYGHKNKYLRLSSKDYERINKLVSENQKGEKNTMYGMCGEKNPFHGKKHTPESLEKMSKAKKGRKLSKEHCEKISKRTAGKSNPMHGKKHTPESIEKNKKNQPNRIEIKIDNIIYLSITEAIRKLNICWKVITYRLKSKNFPNYRYVDEKENIKNGK